MESVLKKDSAFKKIDRETAAAINLFAGMNLKVNEKDEVVDVCRAWEEQKKSGQIEERIDIISKFLENGGTKEEAKRMLEVSEEDIIMAEKRISEIHQTICVWNIGIDVLHSGGKMYVINDKSKSGKYYCGR